MKIVPLLKGAVSRLDGFEFESIDELCAAPDCIFTPLVWTDIEGDEITPEEARIKIASRVRLAFLIYVRDEDVYRRLRGDKAFYHLMLASWNSEHAAAPFSPDRIEQLMNLFIAGRRRYLAKDDSMEANQTTSNLTDVVDRAISIVDDVDSTIPTRAILSLKPPHNIKNASAWPPRHFGPLDIAIMAETETRKALFGVDYSHPMDEEDIPRYPHDQDPPLVARKFLCWVSLAETKPYFKTSLFLAPVAFLAHSERQDWYKTTGHKSRFYATVDEFTEYARTEFKKTEKDKKDHVMCLLTPWFFEKDEVVADAEKKDRAIPTSWEKGCFRAGMMLRVSRVKTSKTPLAYRIVLFKPGASSYTGVTEPLDRREKQDAWVEKMMKKLQTQFEIREGWIGGAIHTHIYPNSRNSRPDSVEVASEIIEATMQDPSTFPSTPDEFHQRDYQFMEQYPGIE
ncbi:hypothetical protein F4805DRAFT_453160 [Annulohypoxylon moriforme]|nr:hypothetical protein F4805DRAFT_453160 [Annulohypoxylon moriforme]